MAALRTGLNAQRMATRAQPLAANAMVIVPSNPNGLAIASEPMIGTPKIEKNIESASAT
jgi:hypothetical protein